jgi:hypothetical protein
MVPVLQRLTRIRPAALRLGLLGLALAPSAQAQIAINFTYNGTDTSLTYFVAANSFSSLTATGTASTSDEHNVRNGGLVNVTAGTMDTYGNPGFTNAAWGTPTVAASSYSGDPIRFFVGSSGVRVPTGFDRATGTLAGTMLWTSTSLMDLGFGSNNSTSGSFAALGTTVNWTTTNTAIPEPGTYAALFGLAALALVAVRRRTRRA